MLLFLCMFSWSVCLLVLAYQGLIRLLQGSWSTLTLFDVTSRFLSLDILDLGQHLPFEWGLKLAYVLMTTELSLALWWVGVFFCLSHLTLKLIHR